MAENALPRPAVADRELANLSKATGRIPALDFTKGALVLIMVLYHWINYFWGPHDNRYLRFLTPSFICISGFLISHVYLARYGVSRKGVPQRLFQRGLKILAVFALLNIGRDFLAPTSGASRASAPSAILRIIDVYVIGSGLGGGQTKAVAFFILVPIGYLLILSALLMPLTRVYRHTFHVACVLFFLSVGILETRGIESANLELLAIGLLGVVAGSFSIDKLKAILEHPYVLTAAYALYVAAITSWNVIYPLQVAGVCLSLLLLYLLGDKTSESGWVSGRIVLLGKYSLFGYIVQIVILQALRRGALYVDLGTVTSEVAFVLAVVLTTVSVELVNRARAGSSVADRLYRFVFA